MNEEKNFYLHFAYLLFRATPKALGRYVDRNYPGGLYHAVQENRDDLSDKLSTRQWKEFKRYIETHHNPFGPFRDELLDSTALDKEVMDILISRCHLDIGDRKVVESYARQTDRNRSVIDLMIHRGLNVVVLLTNVLKELGQAPDLVRRIETELHHDTPQKISISPRTRKGPQRLRIQKRYHTVIKHLKSTEAVVDNLFTNKFLSVEDSEEILTLHTRSDKNRKLLEKLRSEEACEAFIRALEENTIDMNLLQEIRNTDVADLQTEENENSPQLLRIQKCYHKILNNLGSTEAVVDNLITCGILTVEDSEEIKASNTHADKNRKLLEKLRNEEACEAFLQSIEQDAVDKNLSQEIRNTDISDFQTAERDNNEPNQRLCLGLFPILKLLSITKRKLRHFPDYSNADNFAQRGQLEHDDETEQSILHIPSHGASSASIETTNDADLELSAEHSLYQRILDKEESLEIEVNRLRNMYCMTVTSECQMTETEYNECRNTIEETLLKFGEKLQDMYVFFTKSQIGILEEEINLEKDKDNIDKKLKSNSNTVNKWRNDDRRFVKTRASSNVLQRMSGKDFLVITGPAGYGKTYQSRHLALRYQRLGFLVIPVTTPKDIEDMYDLRRPAIFVIDDICGNYTAIEHQVDNWKIFFCSPQYKDITGCQNKMVATCRLYVFRDECLQKLKPYIANECNLASEEFCLNREEKRLLIKEYIDIDECNKLLELTISDYFPLLCSLYRKHDNIPIEKFFTCPTKNYQEELQNFYNHGQTGRLKICCLVLAVLYNNRLPTSFLEQRPSEKEVQMLKDVSECCGLMDIASQIQVKESINSLLNTYFVFEDGVYKVIHDKVFDIIASLLAGILGPNVIQCIIKNGDSPLIHERCIWELNDEHSREFYILLPDSLLQSYISRCMSDWKEGKVAMVFLNINLRSETFRSNMLEQLEKAIDKTDMINRKDISDPGDRPLIRASSEGFTNIVDWLLKNKASVNKLRKGVAALHVASQNGHIDIVRLLLKNGNVNLRDKKGASPLFMASQEGHIDVVRLLIKKRHSNVMCFIPKFAKVNLYRKDGSSPLYIACENGHLDIVRLLIENYADVNLCRNSGGSPLSIACENGHLDIVRLLIEKNGDVNLCNNNGVSPLYMASQNGHLDIVRLLIEKNADVNLCENGGVSPLSTALLNGFLDIVLVLIEKNADVNLCDNGGISPLNMASYEGHLHIVRLLIEKNGDVNLCRNDGVSPLFMASQNGHTDIVRLLIEKNADVNLCKNNGVSPLYMASQNGHLDIVRLLIEKNGDVNLCRNDGVSPLYIACENGHLDIVRLLIEKNADVNLCCSDGNSPLFMASPNGHTDIVRLLIEKNADVNLCENNGVSPLYMASQNGHLDIVRLLIEKNADVNLSWNDGVSPLYIACENGHLDIVRLLIEKNADVNLSRNDGVSPLYIACENGHTDIVRLLIEKNADVNLSRNDGVSPLYIACENGHTDIVRLLIEKNADVNLCNNNGVSPLKMASQNGHLDIVRLLIEKNADVNLCENGGVSPLSTALLNGYLDIVLVLIEKNADVNLCDNGGISPLHVASYEGHLHIVRLLIEKNGDVNLSRNDGVSPLCMASQNGHTDIVRLLIEKNADVNLCKNNGVSPLYMASQNGHLDIVRLLKEKNGDVNLCRNDGVSPLYMASQNGHLDIVRLLIEKNADVNLCRNDGVSPLYIASQNGHLDIVRLLIEKNADVNLCRNDGVSPLYIASQNGHLDIVRLLT